MAFSPQGLPNFNFPGPTPGTPSSFVFTPLPALTPAAPKPAATPDNALVGSTLNTLNSLHTGWSDWQQQRPAASKATGPAPIPPWMNPAASRPVAFQVARPLSAPAVPAPAAPVAAPQPTFMPPSFVGPPPGFGQSTPAIAPAPTRGYGTGWGWRDAMSPNS